MSIILHIDYLLSSLSPTNSTGRWGFLRSNTNSIFGISTPSFPIFLRAITANQFARTENTICYLAQLFLSHTAPFNYLAQGQESAFHILC